MANIPLKSIKFPGLSDTYIVEALSKDAKEALLACFEHVAWIDEHGQDYYDALSGALFGGKMPSSITATFVQGNNLIFTTDSLDTLKQYLSVAAQYSDGTSQVITEYTLTGTLSSGTSVITVSFYGKTTSFNVTVTAWDIEWDYTDGSPLDNGFANLYTGNPGVMTNDGFELTFSESTASGLRYGTDITYAKGIFECEFLLTSMPIAYQGYTVFLPGHRIRVYNGKMYFTASSNNTEDYDIYIADISTDVKHTLRIEWNTSSFAKISVNGSQVYLHNGQLQASPTRFTTAINYLGEVLLKSLKFLEVV